MASIYQGTYFVLDGVPDVPLGGQEVEDFSANILGEAVYQIVEPDNAASPNEPLESGVDGHATIDFTKIISSYTIVPNGVYDGDITIGLGDGNMLSSTDVVTTSTSDGEMGTVGIVVLEDGRALLTIPDAYGAGDFFEAIAANASGALTFSTTGSRISHYDHTGYTSVYERGYRGGTSGTQAYTGDAPCFTTGTLIETQNGPIAVENLQAGDLIKTADHGFQPVKWVGSSRVVDAPIRIAANTFNNTRDLVVSPRHRMLLEGWQMGLLFDHDVAFAAAKDMKNDSTITPEPEGWVTYHHILLDRHEVIFAEGAATESFLPDEASLNSMAKPARDALNAAVDTATYAPAHPTLTANQAMYVGQNLDVLGDADSDQAAVIAAE